MNFSIPKNMRVYYPITNDFHCLLTSFNTEILSVVWIIHKEVKLIIFKIGKLKTSYCLSINFAILGFSSHPFYIIEFLVKNLYGKLPFMLLDCFMSTRKTALIHPFLVVAHIHTHKGNSNVHLKREHIILKLKAFKLIK